MVDQLEKFVVGEGEEWGSGEVIGELVVVAIDHEAGSITLSPKLKKAPDDR